MGPYSMIAIGAAIALAVGAVISRARDDDSLPQDIDLFQYYKDRHGKDEFQIVDIYMREDNNFLQGLYWDTDRKTLIESCGLYGKSKAQWLSIDQTSKVISSTTSNELRNDLFGEGLSILNDDEYIMLTWKEDKILILDRNTLEVKREMAFFDDMKQGWGVTGPVSGDDRKLYISDSTDQLVVVDVNTLSTTGVLPVTLNGYNLKQVNELEYVDGYIWGNVWFSNSIYQIDPQDGKVVRSIDLSNLKYAERDFERANMNSEDMDVLNGIAYDPEENVFYVTGKQWYLVFKIKID